MQSQDYPGSAWGVGQRVDGCLAADVDASLARGDVLRTHVLRPTWHLVLREDIRWLLELTGARIIAGMVGRYRRLALDEKTLLRSAEAIAGELAGGCHRTRAELASALAGVRIEATGARLAHIVMHAELTGLICSGAPRGADHTYALIDERAPASEPLDHDEALARLAARFGVAHSPFRDVDLAWWGGLTLGDARRAIAGSDLVRERDGGQEQWSSSDALETDARSTLRLLPNFDEYVVAYRDRTHVFDDEMIADGRFLHDFLSSHLVVRSGRAIGRWRRPAGGRGDVEIDLFAGIEVSSKSLATVIARYHAFTG